MSNYDFSLKNAIPSIFAFFFFIFQMVYGFVYAYNTKIIFIKYIGVGVFILAGFFSIAPVFIFLEKGVVKQGKSFVHTTKIVDTGIYAIVRHPQYFAHFLWAIGAMLLFQNLVVVVLGIPVIFLTYFDMMREEKRNILKFGESYKKYMKKVPRANFLLGLIRVIIR